MLLSIDPGITTGVAVYSLEGVFLDAYDLVPGELTDTLSNYLGDPWLEVVIEDIPIPTMGRMNKSLRQVVSDLNSLFPNARKVTPGTWKNSAPTRGAKIPRTWMGKKFSAHMKDACLLAHWRLHTLEKEAKLNGKNSS